MDTAKLVLTFRLDSERDCNLLAAILKLLHVNQMSSKEANGNVESSRRPN